MVCIVFCRLRAIDVSRAEKRRVCKAFDQLRPFNMLSSDKRSVILRSIKADKDDVERSIYEGHWMY